TLADCAAIFHLPLAVMACKSVLEEDLLAELPIKAYTQQFASNPNVQKVMADRKANSEVMIALRSGKK
ncbi:MAG: glutathione S-transferase, partial [Limnohabitans sp.]